jgi:hypothetical protein
MKRSLLFFPFLFFIHILSAQKIDSISFHLYTDSLKKGQHNYINVDGKLPNGHWLPLTGKDIIFSCPTASFEGCELIIPADFKDEKVTVRAFLKTNPLLFIVKTIWIKQRPDDEHLPTQDEILHDHNPRKTKTKG